MKNDILHDLEVILTECHRGYHNILQDHELEEVVFSFYTGDYMSP